MKLSVTPHQLTQMLFSDKDQAVAFLRDEEAHHPYLRAVADYFDQSHSVIEPEKFIKEFEELQECISRAETRLGNLKYQLMEQYDG
jgi:hypothetical protein